MAPEGFYAIAPAQMNPNSSYYVSFNMGYPNAYGPVLWPHRRASDGAWRLLLGRLLLDDRRPDRRDLRAGARGPERRAEGRADAGRYPSG